MDTNDLTRRTFIGAAALVPSVLVGEAGAEACSLTINNVRHDLNIEPRVTLLDLLREHLHMPGTKKGCDHGQCGACTVIVNGERVISCLTLAITRDGDSITTIEGLANSNQLHPMQAAFIEHDGFQCGFCTSGQICSAVAMLDEAHKATPRVQLTDAEIRERMSGNICRCGAYPNIVAAIRSVEAKS